MRSDLILSTSPFLKEGKDTPAIMRHVVYALVPAVAAAVYFFGLSAILVLTVCVAGTVFTEWLFTRGRGTVADGSALVTGVLLAMTLPPGIPLWMAFVGGVFAIVLGKLIFGGLGQNIFNPSLVGRAFLQACFPVALTTWSPHSGRFFALKGQNLALPFLHSNIDAVTSATPLAEMKFESKIADLPSLLLGTTAGSLGETCAVALLLGGAYLAIRGFLNWRIPLSIFASVFLLAGILHGVNADHYPQPGFHLFAGGLVLGAVFMATDPVSSPVTHRGCWVFGAGIGVMVVVIRHFGGLPEGVMYSILFMNALVPLINRVTNPRVYGVKS